MSPSSFVALDPAPRSSTVLLLVAAVAIFARTAAADPEPADAAAADVDEDAAADAELPNFKTMKLKELRAILDERGVECKVGRCRLTPGFRS